MATSAIGALAEIWASVDAIRSSRMIVPRPANSFTVAEYAERYGIPRSTAKDQIGKLLASGALSEHCCLLPDNRGRMVQQRVFTP